MQSIARKRVPPRCHPGQRHGTVWQPASLPAVRSTATFLARYGACSIQSDKLLQYGRPPVRNRARLLFEYSVWVSKFANEQIENAARCVQTAAELTDTRSRDTAVKALLYVN